MVQNDPRAEENEISKYKIKKNIFQSVLVVFCLFLVVVGPFSRSKIEKNSNFFSGIDLEWSETPFKSKILRKKFSSSFKFLGWPLRNFRASLKDPKPVKPNILKNYRFKIFQGVVHYSFS